MKKFNLAALPLAVAGVLASTSALAGTEACFEVYTGADDLNVTAFHEIYNLASCGARGTADASTLATNDSVSIAYELTGKVGGDNAFDLDFDDIDAGISVAVEDQVIVYIPTTDIPGGTIIKMELSGSNALFANNGNQIHLVKDIDGEDDATGSTDGFEAVASSDGSFDTTSDITFITKAGVTIGAGTRLVFSQVSTGPTQDDFVPISISLGNDECTDPTAAASSVVLSVASAVTDGGQGFPIEGAITKTPQVIAEISAQYHVFLDGTRADALVNAESTGSDDTSIIARTEFIYDTDAAEQLVVQSQQLIYATAFYDRSPALDQYVIIDGDDELKTSFVSVTAPGESVEIALYNGQHATTSVLSDQEEIEDNTNWAEIGLTEADADVYDTEAPILFTPAADANGAESNPTGGNNVLAGALYNEMYYVLTNNRDNATDSDDVMNFNYTVNTSYELDFNDADLKDHCELDKDTHKVGVNGAVLKVPYVTTAGKNFVRITNEHDKSAEVTFDMFGESADGTEENRKVTALSLGTIPAQSSVVYMMDEVLDVATANGYTGADGGYAAGDLGTNFVSNDLRATVTFTVTAPSDSVHGVAVQRLAGSTADRVMPVLDQNNWSQ